MQWKTIPQCPNYEVSDQGEVRNKKTGRVLKAFDSAGYLAVQMMNDSERIQMKIHRLVACAFVDGYEEGLEVDHINRDRYDNKAENLRWCSHSDNLRNTVKTKRILNETFGFEFDSMAEAAEWLVAQKMSKNMHSATSCLWQHLKGKTKTCAKCVWRYIDND